MNTTYLNVIIDATNTAIANNDSESLKKIFANLKQYKSGNESESTQIQKYFNDALGKRQIAIAKQLTKYSATKVTASSETAKEQLNVLTLPYEEQRKKIRGMLNNMCKSGKYELHFDKKQYLAEFDTLTESEFNTLYCGKAIEKSTLIRVLTQRLIKAEKASK